MAAPEPVGSDGLIHVDAYISSSVPVYTYNGANHHGL